MSEDWFCSAVMLLVTLNVPKETLITLRKECFDDSHWARIIDAALAQQEKS